jgi:hypothetical protein
MSLNRRVDEIYQNTEELHVGKWRWLMIPLVTIGIVVLVLSILFAGENCLKKGEEVLPF